jgi:CRISPR-associated endonuclease Csn1
MVDKRFCADKAFADGYVREQIKKITGKQPLSAQLLLGGRHLKINTVLELDGTRCCISNKDGDKVGLRLMTPNIMSVEDTEYFKAVESYVEKRKRNSNLLYSPDYDKVTEQKNVELYDALCAKAAKKPFSNMPGLPTDVLRTGRKKFIKLTLDEQCQCLIQLMGIFKTGRASGCNLVAIGGASTAARLRKTVKLSPWAKDCKSVCIIDSSASGLFETRSQNLLELL